MSPELEPPSSKNLAAPNPDGAGVGHRVIRVIGMVVVVAREQADDILDRLGAVGERGYRIGEIEAKEPEEAALLFREGSQ